MRIFKSKYSYLINKFWRFQLTFVAASLWIASPSIWAVANSSVLFGAANSFNSTPVADNARVLARLRNAGLVAAALRVQSALRLNNCLLFVAVDEWISLQVCRTFAVSSVIFRVAFSIASARVGNCAHIEALSVDTSLSGCAFAVTLAARLLFRC